MKCSDITVNQFRAALKGDLSIVGGSWEDIYNEYISLRENKQSSYVLDLIKEITYLETKEFIIVKVVQVLAKPIYSRELVMELLQCGCKGKFDFSDLQAYSTDLGNALKYSATYRRKADQKQKDLDEYRARHGGTISEDDYFNTIAVKLWRFMGSRVDYDVVRLSEFCHLVNEYDKYCEASAEDRSNEIANRKVNTN